MIFNVDGDGTAKQVKYDNTNSSLESENIQGAVDELADRLTNENSETFNFGIKDGVRGFFTDPSRADDSFIPFTKLQIKDVTVDSNGTTVELDFEPTYAIATTIINGVQQGGYTAYLTQTNTMYIFANTTSRTYGAGELESNRLWLDGNKIIFSDQIYGTSSISKTYTIIAWT